MVAEVWLSECLQSHTCIKVKSSDIFLGRGKSGTFLHYNFCITHVLCVACCKSQISTRLNGSKTRVGKREITQCPLPYATLSDSLTNKQQGHSEVQHVPGQNVSGAASRSTFLLVCERRAANRLRFYWSENGITDQNLRDQHA